MQRSGAGPTTFSEACDSVDLLCRAVVSSAGFEVVEKLNVGKSLGCCDNLLFELKFFQVTVTTYPIINCKCRILFDDCGLASSMVLVS